MNSSESRSNAKRSSRPTSFLACIILRVWAWILSACRGSSDGDFLGRMVLDPASLSFGLRATALKHKKPILLVKDWAKGWGRGKKEEKSKVLELAFLRADFSEHKRNHVGTHPRLDASRQLISYVRSVALNEAFARARRVGTKRAKCREWASCSAIGRGWNGEWSKWW